MVPVRSTADVVRAAFSVSDWPPALGVILRVLYVTLAATEPIPTRLDPVKPSSVLR